MSSQKSSQSEKSVICGLAGKGLGRITTRLSILYIHHGWKSISCVEEGLENISFAI